MKPRHKEDIERRIKDGIARGGSRRFAVSGYKYVYKCTCKGKCTGACMVGSLIVQEDKVRVRCSVAEVSYCIDFFEKNINQKTGEFCLP